MSTREHDIVIHRQEDEQIPTDALRQKEKQDDLLENLKQIQDGVVEGRPLEPHALVLFLMRYVPGLTGVLGGTKRALANVSNFFTAINESTDLVKQVGKTLPVVSVVLDVINFLIYPVAAVASKVLTGEWPPLKLTTLAKVAYAALLLALTLTAILVPPTAPFIALTSLALPTAVAAWSMYNVFREGKLLRAELTSFKTGHLKKQLDAEREKYNDLREANQFELRAAALRARLVASSDNTQEMALCLNDIELLQKAHDVAKAPYQILLNREVQVKQKFDEITRKSYLLDKIIAIGLLSFALSGTIIAVAFPPLAPAGFLMAFGGVSLLAAYALARLTYNVGFMLYKKYLGRTGGNDELPTLTSEILSDNDHRPELCSLPRRENSTCLMMTGLSAENSGQSATRDVSGRHVDFELNEQFGSVFSLQGKHLVLSADSDLEHFPGP